MNWIRENFFWIAVVVFFIWMHTRMHGGHGTHGSADQPHEHDEKTEGRSHAQH